MSRKVADSEKVEWNERHDLGLSGDAIIAAFDDAATLAMEHGTEPTYTMQQAIDKIVDGLVLPWVEVRQGYWGAKKNCFAATVDVGVYRVWEEFGQCWYGVPSSLIHPQVFDEIRCGSLDSGMQLCLDDYRKRVRDAIEKAVSHA